MVTALTGLLGQAGTAMGSLAKGAMGGFGEGAGLTGLASKFGEQAGVTGGWADAGRQIGQLYGRTQSSMPLATTLRTAEAFQQTPTFKNLLMQLASKGTEGKKKKQVGSIIIPPPSKYIAGEEEE